ncbi:hypothetical protein [Chitinophaga polysaccharea]|uniref:hypothetical protein n=1 Tax=Chitinophaga polysaccharea TaxID=1293035 RepID=UPI001158821F|nr:hypothetical protein [Chitinophaga polysaccharea]
MPTEKSRVEVYKIHDYYNSDSIEIEHPDGKITHIKKDSLQIKSGTINLRKITTETILYPKITTTPIFPPTLPKIPESNTEENFFSGVPFVFSESADAVSQYGLITSIINIGVEVYPKSAYFTSNGREVTRTAKVSQVTYDCTPLLPVPETIFTLHWMVFAYYTYTPYYPPLTKQFYYDKSTHIIAKE